MLTNCSCPDSFTSLWVNRKSKASFVGNQQQICVPAPADANALLAAVTTTMQLFVSTVILTNLSFTVRPQIIFNSIMLPAQLAACLACLCLLFIEELHCFFYGCLQHEAQPGWVKTLESRASCRSALKIVHWQLKRTKRNPYKEHLRRQECLQ